VVKVVCVLMSLCEPGIDVCVRVSLTAAYRRADGESVLMWWSADQCKQSDHWSACPAVHSSHQPSGKLSLAVACCVTACMGHIWRLHF